jgi:CBS domain-containing protein
MGFTRVYDYAAGKDDWGSFGLPLEGDADSSTRVSSVTRADAPTCRPDELISEVATRVAEDWRICVVTNEEGVVLGLLKQDVLHAREPVRADDRMFLGPSTIRPSARKEAVVKRMREQSLTRIVVTRSDGVLVGVLRREDLEAKTPG